jgi:hypothetical protein
MSKPHDETDAIEADPGGGEAGSVERKSYLLILLTFSDVLMMGRINFCF